MFEMKREGKSFKNSIAKEFDEACSGVSEKVMKRFHLDRGNVSVEDYIFDNCRIATAHASKKFPSDADMSSETRRLSVAGEIMQALARHHIRSVFAFSETYLSDKQSQ